MERRALGRTGHQVSAVGFGTWGLGGDMWRGLDRDEARAALRAAISGGCDLIDTALVYGWGESEKLVGEVIRETGGAIVATKVPPLDERWPPAPDTPLERIFPADHLVRSVETSLRNLQVDALEIEQLHVWLDAWLDSTYWPELRGAMEGLVRAGKVRHWGISVNDHAPETALRAMDEPLIETVQVIHNIFDR
jgi:aryl-alcohol dehydrogenase-like predicted oxidoreductase